MIENYPDDSPGYQDTDTSIAAAESVTEDAATIRDRCYHMLGLLSIGGLTADEVASHLRLSVLTVRPRITELNQQGLIEDTGERRKNSSGRKAIVWRVWKEPEGQGKLF